MHLHPTYNPVPRETFEELMSSMNEYSRVDRLQSNDIPGSVTERSNVCIQRHQQIKGPTQANTGHEEVGPTHTEPCTESRSQTSTRIAKMLFRGRKNSAHRISDDQNVHNKQGWDGTVYHVISNSRGTNPQERLSSSIAMAECERSIARLQRALEHSGQKSAKKRPILKIDASINGKETDTPANRPPASVSVPPLRFPGFASLSTEKANHSDQKQHNDTWSALGNMATSDVSIPSGIPDHSVIISLLTKMSMASNFREVVKVVHTELVSASDCDRVQVHFINPTLNMSKLDNDAFQRKFDLWTTNYPDSNIPNSHSQQAARQCITIRVNDDSGLGNALYIPITMPTPGAASSWKIFGVVDLFRGSEKHWTQTDESKVKFVLELCSPILMERYKAIRMNYEKKIATLMSEAAQVLHSQERPEALCQHAAVFACRLTNAQAARVLLVSEDGKSGIVYEPGSSGGRKIQKNSNNAGVNVVEGELSAVFISVIKTAKGISVADTRRDARFAGQSTGPTHHQGSQARPASGSETATLYTAQPPSARPNTAPDGTYGSVSHRVTHTTAGLLPQPPASGSAAHGDGPCRSARFRGFSAQTPRGRLHRNAGLIFREEKVIGGGDTEGETAEPLDKFGILISDSGDASRVSSWAVPPNTILLPVMDDHLLDESSQGEASGRPVRGVLQVVNKRTGPFDDWDCAELAVLCAMLYRCLIQVDKMKFLQETLSCDCRLLASSSVQSIVSSALDKLRASTRSDLAAFYVPNERRRVLESEGVEQRHEVPMSEEMGYPVATSFWRRQVVHIINHARDTKLQASGISQAVPFFRAMRHSICQAVVHPSDNESVLAVILLANKIDSLERGYDEVDMAKLENTCVKVGHALVGILRQRELNDQCSAEHALTRCCTELLTSKCCASVMRVVYRFAPAAFGAEDISLWLPDLQHKEALWTSQSSRTVSAANGLSDTLQEETLQDDEVDEGGRDKYYIPFPEWLTLHSGCVTLSGSSPHEYLRWASEASSFFGQSTAADSSLIFVLPLLALVSSKPGLLLFRFASRRTTKDESSVLDFERAEQLRKAVDKALLRVHDEEELLRGASVLEKRLHQHEQLLQLVPQVVAQTSMGRMLNVGQRIAKEVVHTARVDLYLTSQSAASSTSTLVWHDPDKALTSNISKAPDLELPLGGLLGLAVRGHCEYLPGLGVLSNNVPDDPRYDKEVDNRSHWAHPVTMLCCPITAAIADSNICLGVLQLVNKIDPGGFNEHDAQLAAKVSSLIGTCVESSRRQDKQAELLLSVARFAANLSVKSIVHSLISAVVRWLDSRASVIQVWVLSNPSSNQLSLHSSCIVSSPSDPRLDRPKDDTPELCILPGPGCQNARMHDASSLQQPNDFVLRCYSKHEKVHIQRKAGSESPTFVAELDGESQHHHNEEHMDSQGVGEFVDNNEILCLPIPLAKDSSQPSSGDVSEKVWGVLELQTLPGQRFTTLDVSLMTDAAVHAGTCLTHAETKTDYDSTLAATSRLFQLTAELFSCKSTLALFKAACTTAHQIIDAQYISLFALDNEGRQVREEYTAQGGILPSESPCYKLKRRVAMLVGHSMCEVGSFVAEDIEARNSCSSAEHEGDGDDDKHHDAQHDLGTHQSANGRISVHALGNRHNKTLYHCAGFPLWRARATEELSKGSTSAATSRPLYGVLVCLRPITSLEFRSSECTPLQFLCMMVAERVVEIRKKAQKIGESFVRRTSEQARKDLDDKHGGDVGRSILTELAARRLRRNSRTPSPAPGNMSAVAAAAQSLARSPSSLGKMGMGISSPER